MYVIGKPNRSSLQHPDNKNSMLQTGESDEDKGAIPFLYLFFFFIFFHKHNPIMSSKIG